MNKYFITHIITDNTDAVDGTARNA